MTKTSPFILIVEDEPLVSSFLEDVLVEEGAFRVLTASNATDALSILAGSADIGVVLSDQHMPGSMEGPELLHHVHRRWPSIALVLMSGRWRDGSLPPGARFIQKPVFIADLLGLMHELLR